MEYVVDLPLFWWLQLKGYRGYDLGDFKGASLFCQEFPRRYLEFEVSCFKPDFVSDFPSLKQKKVHSFMRCCASLWVALASFHASSIWLSRCLRAGRKVFLRGGYNHGSYPIIRKNGDLPVTE